MKNYTNPRSLTDKELLDMILHEHCGVNPISDSSAFSNPMQDLINCSVEELMTIKGIGRRRAERIVMLLELAKRIYTAPPSPRTIIKSPDDIAAILMPEMRYLDREHFKSVYLNRKNHVLAIETVSIGGLSSSLVSPREVFKPAIRRSAASVILSHCHPSGDPTPSREDIDVTKRLCEAGRILGIEVLDHIVIGDGRFVSLKAQNLM